MERPEDLDILSEMGHAITANASIPQTYFNMFKIFIGIGILATPSSIKQVGVIGGSVGILICGLLNIYTMRCQLKCKDKVGEHVTSYSELGMEVFGPQGKAFVDFCITVSQFGFCIAYLIFIGNQMDQVICIETQQDVCGHKNFFIIVSALILVPISWLRKFSFISYISLFASISIVFALAVIMTYGEENYVNHPEAHKNIRYVNARNMPLFFGVAVFNFEGNGVILNVQSSMKDPDQFDRIMRTVMIGIISILILFSVFSYEAFGDQIDDMVTMNLPHDNLTTSV
mmetsp:Transcript_17653/g.29828  ORF Transcript_17653/g.29828 Transcript_17653/m.29828 type:complete len:286 (+) Transcript_17653:421-1278(+)